jgi:UDP-N-acetylmuramyl tripeptide synthase
VPLDRVGPSLEGFGGAFGRVETIPVGERELSILLVKNPAGANEVLRTLTLEDGSLDLWLALNDRIADGRDVSWIWDADFELLAGRIRRVTCSGTRAEEMALRLKYAGMNGAEIAVDRDLDRSLDAALEAAPDTGRLYALPTYTALLELRDLLARRGLAKRWSE